MYIARRHSITEGESEVKGVFGMGNRESKWEAMPRSIPGDLMCHLPSVGREDARGSVMNDVRLRDEGPQFFQINGGGANAEHAMAKSAKSAEKVERGDGELISTGK